MDEHWKRSPDLHRVAKQYFREALCDIALCLWYLITFQGRKFDARCDMVDFAIDRIEECEAMSKSKEPGQESDNSAQ